MLKAELFRDGARGQRFRCAGSRAPRSLGLSSSSWRRRLRAGWGGLVLVGAVNSVGYPFISSSWLSPGSRMRVSIWRQPLLGHRRSSLPFPYAVDVHPNLITEKRRPRRLSDYCVDDFQPCYVYAVARRKRALPRRRKRLSGATGGVNGDGEMAGLIAPTVRCAK